MTNTELNELVITETLRNKILLSSLIEALNLKGLINGPEFDELVKMSAAGVLRMVINDIDDITLKEKLRKSIVTILES